MAEIEIGKFTLESLTTGMYNDPEIVYREYIQNAVDSFDNAVEQKIMTADDCRIEIIVDADRQEISIKDNGTGIKKDQAVKTLLDIGNSSKTHTSNRGLEVLVGLEDCPIAKSLAFAPQLKTSPKKQSLPLIVPNLKNFWCLEELPNIICSK